MHCSTTPASRRYLAPPSAISVKATCVSLFPTPSRTSVRVVLLIIGLIGIYSMIYVFISGGIIGFGPRLGAFMAVGLLVGWCVLSWPAVAILGRGEGALAVVTFLGMSLLIAESH